MLTKGMRVHISERGWPILVPTQGRRKGLDKFGTLQSNERNGCVLTTGSEDPSDPRQTVRVLTIMLASEY